jgi:hypothetical protein
VLKGSSRVRLTKRAARSDASKDGVYAHVLRSDTPVAQLGLIASILSRMDECTRPHNMGDLLCALDVNTNHAGAFTLSSRRMAVVLGVSPTTVGRYLNVYNVLKDEAYMALFARWLSVPRSRSADAVPTVGQLELDVFDNLSGADQALAINSAKGKSVQRFRAACTAFAAAAVAAAAAAAAAPAAEAPADAAEEAAEDAPEAAPRAARAPKQCRKRAPPSSDEDEQTGWVPPDAAAAAASRGERSRGRAQRAADAAAQPDTLVTLRELLAEREGALSYAHDALARAEAELSAERERAARLESELAEAQKLQAKAIRLV